MGRVDPDALIKFLEELRNANYRIGSTQHIAAQDLLLAYASEGDPIEDAERLKSVLRPLLCSNAAEQAGFDSHFDPWASRLFRAAPHSTAPAPRVRSAPDHAPALTDLDELGRRSKILWRSAWGVVATVSSILVLLYAMRSTDTGTVLIHSSPPGAHVFVLSEDDDSIGVWLGQTEVALVDYPVGSHQLRLQSPGYQETFATVDVTPDSVDHPNIPLVPLPPGTLRVTSDPPGAEVTLDGRVLGETPLQADSVEVGSHSLRIALEGYEPASSPVSIQPGQSAAVSVPLLALDAAASFESDPPGAQIVLDGKRIGVTPLEDVRLASGTHSVVFAREGFHPHEASFAATRDRVESIHGTLAAIAMGIVNVGSDPQGAQVMVDGQNFGLTPISIPRLREGPHEFVLRRDGFADWTTSLLVRGDTERSLQARLRLQERPVNRVAFSPDGRTLATGGPDEDIVLWRVDDGIPTDTLAGGRMRWTRGRSMAAGGADVAWPGDSRELSLFSGHGGQVYQAFPNVDGSLIGSVSSDGTFRLWDVVTGEERARLSVRSRDGAAGGVRSLAFSPDGATVALGKADGDIDLVDISGNVLNYLGPPMVGHGDAVWSLTFASDGRFLASASWDGTARLWDVDTGALMVPPLRGHQDRIGTIAVSPDRTVMATAGRDQTIRLWNLPDGTPRGVPISDHRALVRSVAFSPEGTTLASAGWDRTIRLWDARTGQAIGEPLRGHEDQVEALAFSPDGSVLASAGDDDVLRLWDPERGVPIGQPLRGHTQDVYSVSFSPDGGTLISASSDRSIRTWDVGQALGSEPYSAVHTFEHRADVWDATFSPDGALMATASGRTVHLWNAARGTLVDEFIGHDNDVRSLEFSPDGGILVSADDGGIVRTWEASTGISIDVLEGHTGPVWSLAFSPDAQLLASASDDRTVRLWDMTTAQPVTGLFLGVASVDSSAPPGGGLGGLWSRGLAFSPDGSLLAAATSGDDVELFDRTGARVGTLSGAGGYTVAFSPDGTLIATGGGNLVSIWDRTTFQRIGLPLSGHTSIVMSVAFGPDGNLLVSASNDATVRLWDPRSRRSLTQPLRLGEEVTSVEVSPDGQTLLTASADRNAQLWRTQPSAGGWYQALVQEVGYSPDSSRLAAGRPDGTVVVWNTVSESPIDTLVGHDERVSSVAYSGDGRFLASGDAVGKVILRRTEPDVIHSLRHPQDVTTVAVGQGDTLLASGDLDGTVRLWDARAGEPVGTPLDGHEGRITALAFSRGDHLLASAGTNGTVRLWDTSLREPIGQALDHATEVRAIAIRPADTLVAVASADGFVSLWDGRTSLRVTDPFAIEPTAGSGAIAAIGFSPNAEVLVASSDDGTIRLYDLESVQPVGEPLVGHRNGVAAIAFSPDGSRLVSAGSDDTVRRWNLSTGDSVGGPPIEHYALGVAFSRDGERLASVGADGTVRLWDFETGEPIGEPLFAGTGPATAVAFVSDDGLASTSPFDGVVQLWDLGIPRVLEGHTDEVLSLAFTPDGSRLASASTDGDVRIWSTQTDLLVETLSHGDRPVEGVAFDGTGSRLASTTADRSVVIWDTSTSRLQTVRGWLLGPASGWMLTLALALIGVPFLLRAYMWRRRANTVLMRQESDEQPNLERIALKGVERAIFPALALFGVARRLKQRVEVQSGDLDVHRTVAATVDRGGVFSPAFTFRKVRPEFLALVDRSAFGDHQAQYFDDLLGRLEEDEVLVNWYFFDGDPRICFPRGGKGTPRTLSELHRQHPDDRILLFTDARHLFSAVTGQREHWADQFLAWSRRILLTPEPLRKWGARERQLQGDFQVYPATAEGLAELSRSVEDRNALQGTARRRRSALPSYLWRRERRWIQRDEPTTREVDRLLTTVREYLGPDGFQWLAACAVYPALSWRLTLNLGYALRAADGSMLLDERRLIDLARLPWFRRAYLPDWLRRRLIAELSIEREKEVRGVLERLLFDSVEGSHGEFDLELATRESRALHRLAGPLLKHLRKDAPAHSPLRDYVFLDFMRGGLREPLAVRAPRAVKALFDGVDGSNSPARTAKDVRRLKLALAVGIAAFALFRVGARGWDLIPPSPIAAQQLFAFPSEASTPSPETDEPVYDYQANAWRPMATVGGIGGEAFATQCPAESFLTGLDYVTGDNWTFGQGREQVYGVRGVCGGTSLDEGPGEVMTADAGGDCIDCFDGTIIGTYTRMSCPSGHAVVGLRGWSVEQLVSGLQLFCAPATSGTAADFERMVPLPPVGGTTQESALAASLDSTALMLCDPASGEVATGIAGRSGHVIDAFTLSCGTDTPSSATPGESPTGVVTPDPGSRDSAAISPIAPRDSVLVPLPPQLPEFESCYGGTWLETRGLDPDWQPLEGAPWEFAVSGDSLRISRADGTMWADLTRVGTEWVGPMHTAGRGVWDPDYRLPDATPGCGRIEASPWAYRRPEASEPNPATERSLRSDVPVSLLIANGTNEPVDVLWLNFDGTEVRYLTLPPGGQYLQPTFATHPWRFRNSAGLIDTYTPNTAAEQRFLIRDRDSP